MARSETMNKGKWKNSEVKALFACVEEFKAGSKSIKQAFESHAKRSGRAPNSVRNYYYHELADLANDEKRRKNLGIDLSKHQKTEIKFFSKEEENALMKQIDQKVKAGVSVRKVCLELAHGDASLMLRYQNKYRNFISKKAPAPDNVIKFVKRKSGISESEIEALFLGLVRLVKRSARQEAEEAVREQTEGANQELRKAVASLAQKEKEIEALKEQFARLKAENLKLFSEKEKLACSKASALKAKLEESKLNKRLISK